MRGVRLPEVKLLATKAKRRNEKKQIRTQEFMKDVPNNSYFCQASATVAFPGSTYNDNRNGFLMQIVHISEEGQKVDPTSLPARLLYLSHYPTLTGCRGERRVYNTMRREYHWRPIANNLYTTIRDCCKCIRNKSSDKHKRPLQLLRRVARQKFVAMRIFGPLPKTSNRN